MHTLALFLLVLSQQGNATEPSALDQNPQGWTELLLAEGKENLESWTRMPIPPAAKLSEESPWKLDPKTGILTCAGDSSGHEWLRWDEELGDAIMHAEWRFVPVEAPQPARYNSGVMVRNSADGSIWHQAQMGSGGGGFLFGDSPVEGKVTRVNFSKEVKDKRVKPAGEWNVFEIHSRGDTISLWVNGAFTSTWERCEVLRGFFGLEAEGYRVEFRNVRIKKL